MPPFNIRIQHIHVTSNFAFCQCDDRRKIAFLGFSKGRIDKAKELKILVLEVHFCFVVVVEPFLVENTVFRVDRFILFLRVKGSLSLCHLHDHQIIVREFFLPENFCPGQHLFPVRFKELSCIFLMVFIRQVSEDIFPLLPQVCLRRK